MNNLLGLWFITGLTDAEGSFLVCITKYSQKSIGYSITYAFNINLNYRDKLILESIKETLGVGEIYYNPSDKTCRYKVSNLKDLSKVIIPHFNKYPLVTQKYVDFCIFKDIINLIENKEHSPPPRHLYAGGGKG